MTTKSLRGNGSANSPKRTQPNRGIRAKLMEHFHKHPGEELFASDLAEMLGVDERAIQNCVSNLRSTNPDYPLETLVRGRSWRYSPNGKSKRGNGSEVKRVFEELAVTKAGELLIQDEAGTVYLAREL